MEKQFSPIGLSCFFYNFGCSLIVEMLLKHINFTVVKMPTKLFQRLKFGWCPHYFLWWWNSNWFIQYYKSKTFIASSFEIYQLQPATSAFFMLICIWPFYKLSFLFTLVFPYEKNNTKSIIKYWKGESSHEFT